MRLIKNDILRYTKLIGNLFFNYFKIPADKAFDEAYVMARLKTQGDLWSYRDAIDATVTYYLAQKAKTFVFSTKTILELPLNTALKPGFYNVPYPEMIFQFTEPIPEHVLGMTGAKPGGKGIPDDAICGLVIGWPNDDLSSLINITAYYQSTAFNRAILPVAGNGEVDYERAIGGFIPGGREDKQIITNLGLWCLAYINSPRIEIERIPAPSPEVNKKRMRKGKEKLEEYHILKVRKEIIKYPTNIVSVRIGGKHKIKYDVRSHPRRLKTGKVIIIPAHKRGLENEVYVSKVYDVTGGVDE